MDVLTKNNALQVLDLLTARCAFEREAIGLYDAVIAKIERNAEARYHVILEQLRRIRAEEREHEEWLAAQIRALGGDPRATSAFSQLEAEETQGVKNVIVDGHQQVPHLLHALIAAELADNADWELLVKLASDSGDGRARRAFERRRAEEARHLVFLREALHATVAIEVLGLSRELPRAPARRRLPAVPLLVAGIAGLAALLWLAVEAYD